MGTFAAYPVLLVVLSLIVAGGCSSDAFELSTSNVHRAKLVCPKIVNAGGVKWGDDVQVLVELSNPGVDTVRVAKWQSGCECVTVEPPSIVVLPGSNAKVNATADFSNEDTFVGHLGVHVEGLDAEGRKVAEFELNVRVQRLANAKR